MIDHVTASDRAKQAFAEMTMLLEESKRVLTVLSHGHTRVLVKVEVRWRHDDGGTGCIAWGKVEPTEEEDK